MKISEKLKKRFIDNSISLNEEEMENIFFRQNDPNTLITLSKYIRDVKKINKVSFELLKEFHLKDSLKRIEVFKIVQNIEERLNGYIVQYIAYENENFHLNSENFNLNPNDWKKFINISKFLLDLKTKNFNLLKNDSKFINYTFIHMHDFLSTMSLGMKVKLIKYSKENFKKNVMKGFNMSSNNKEINFSLDFLFHLNYLRNKAAHHNPVINFVWKSEYGTFNIEDFLKISTFFLKSQKENIKFGIKSKKMIKKEILKIINK